SRGAGRSGAGGGSRAGSRERPREGRRKSAPKKTSAGRGGPPLEELSKDELYRRATDRGVKGRSRMTREQLAEALGASKKAA
ncbi:Ku protein, partial [Streptomyces albus]